MGELATERWGDAGPRVILVHGSLGSAATAFSEQQALAGRWTLIAPYRRGYSPSPATERIDADRDADEILELVGDGAHLVGTSMGGVVAMRAAARAPERIWSLTVIEPPALPNAAERPEAAALAAALERHWAENGDADLETFVAGFLRALDVDMVMPSPLPPPLAEAVGNLRTERPWETGVPLDALAGAAFPKLVVSGGGTPGFEAVCDVLAERLPGKRVCFDGSPHAVQRIGEPFNAELEAFLSAAEDARPR
ncbi:MAG TPA: alpha/beta hydrolase [Mycobacteriales bacterium]|jgi:pimeloyl-ACP methyl ester carboxylesterase|nr:alpha/beta hydrolase [Mycobacteriales bacterium]